MYARLPGTSGEIRRRRPISSRLCRAVDGDERVFVIVGGGPAGLSAVQTLREEGYTGHIRLISKEDHLPYVCARHVGITHRASEWSLYVCMHVGTTAPYSIATLGRPKKWKTSSERPPCARRSSTRNMMSLRSWQQRVCRSNAAARSSYVRLCSYLGAGSEVVSLDTASQTINTYNGGSIHYDKLLCATGGSARSFRY